VRPVPIYSRGDFMVFLERLIAATALDIVARLPHPAAQRFGRAPELLGDRRDRRSLRRVGWRVLEHRPHRALAHLRRKPAWSRHDHILSRSGDSGKPGAVQREALAEHGKDETNPQPSVVLKSSAGGTSGSGRAFAAVA